MESAEQAAQSPPRDTNGYLKYYASHRLNLFTDDGKVAAGAREMLLMGNRHFDHLAVNVSLSAVLLPPRIQDTGNCQFHVSLHTRTRLYIHLSLPCLWMLFRQRSWIRQIYIIILIFPPIFDKCEFDVYPI